MRIVNLQTFRSLPEGTIFCTYEPYIYGSLCVKGKVSDVDTISAYLQGWPESLSTQELKDKLDSYSENGESFKIQVDDYGPDLFFEDDQLFAIYEKEDLQQLIGVLQDSLNAID